MTRILTKNGVDNTNIDGARNYNFNAGRRSGIVQGALNQGNFFASNNNTIALDTCELRLCGHRIVLDKAEYRTFTNKPSVPVRYSFVARVVVDSDDNVSFEFVSQEATTQLVQDNLDITGSGTYELEIGKFTQLTDGNITDVVRTADLITGGADNDSDYIRIGTVTTNKISPELDADVDIENTINPTDNKPQTNFTFNLPTSVGTVVSVNGEEKTSINTDITPIASSENLITSGGVHDYPAVTFAESEWQKSKNLFPYETVSGNNITQKFFNPLPAGTYTLSAIVSSASPDTQCLVEVYYKNTWVSQYKLTKSSTRTSATKTINSQFDELRFYGGSPNYVYDFTFSQVQLEEGSVATDYQPYNGEIIHEKKLNEIVNGKYPIDINACTTYDQVYNLLQNATCGQCGIGVNHTSAIKSLLPAFPTNAFYVDCVANIIKNKYTASVNLYAIRFTGCQFGFNQPIYYCDVFYDGENTVVTGWYKPETIELIYDIDTKNIVGGTPYTSGIKFGASTNINVSGYSKIKIYSKVYNTYNITEVVIDKTGWTGNSFMIFGEASAIKNIGILIYHEGVSITPAECFNFSDGAGLNNNDNAYVYRIEGYK